ncbi:MAG: hypothetical protein COY73_00955 [Candidatus Nealsonbacteria bacterium CG_4_10_14_0_8_um_filter_37_14]|uniref:EVE domain-containing protein n=1 Tax=Candidatus Nealsonbacteria bacterium CG_4_10_14_0_8_um_filter_37_14 TaxID=1974684 RepID=A0A2M7R7G0_9BACT|nr:MAG: hypothetical protein COZ89_00690 [Candidatus Nealsonbacteria bacterium CG_4_8_14_3_um_filter_37_23]PIY89456.1 MAG: hypothetical protein COY73_00955 [Candidatus Nealsonbacteria bacterium CG_4_10_14_0_8_um_filter_37_14]
MSYHILLSTKENFEICIKKGVYGAIKSSSDKVNAEVISCTLGVKPGDFVFIYVKNVGIYGLWRINSIPFYDEEKVWLDSDQKYPFRFCFEPIIRKFKKPVALSDILDLRDKGKIWTFDLGSLTRKNQYTVTTNEGKEIIRLLLRNNPIFIPAEKIKSPYKPQKPESIPLSLECDNRGRIKYEGFLNAWFMQSFSENKLKNLIGDYKDFINYVPTSFNKVMDLFLTHVTPIDSVEILHKFTCIELKTDIVTEENLKQIIRYENWLIRKLADGDSEMVQSILVGFSFDEAVLNYREKRKSIEEKPVRLIKYKVDRDENDISLTEI